MARRSVVSHIFIAIALLAVISAAALCFIFPSKYGAEIDAAAREFDLDRALVRSVVWAESKYDPSAVSDKGAVGLMQLMPTTFESCAATLGIRDADCCDPVTNLRCGCYYLSLMLERFDGDELAALYAYNAGEANANKFLAGDTVFSETQKYIADINFARRFYGIIY